MINKVGRFFLAKGVKFVWLFQVNQCSANHIKTEKKLLEEHSKKLAKHLQKNEGIWLSSFWTKIMMSFFIFYTILLLIYAYIK